MTQSLSIRLPEALYEQLFETARATAQPLETVVLQSIRVGAPPDLAKVPERFRNDLRALNHLDTSVLWRVAQTELEADRVRGYEALLAKNQQEALSDEERAQLDQLREMSDLLMLRRAYAYALLKWRGQRIPPLQDL